MIKEAAIAAGLTALMILLFLGSWRSTLIVVVSIPLSILVSIIMLGFLGQTLNVMTLGGMALAVGILVDDATVEIENIHRNLHQRKRLVQAILDGASQIAVPAFVSTICICIVFVPVVFITGAARYLFTPLAMAVVFAMLTSYLLSRTLVPTMVHYLLASEVEMYGGVVDQSDPHAMKALHAHEDHGQGRARRSIRGRIWIALLVIVLLVLTWGVLHLVAVSAAGAGMDSPHLEMIAAIQASISQVTTLAGNWSLVNWRLLVEGILGLAALAALIWMIGEFNLLWRVHNAFNNQFERFRLFYGGFLAWALEHHKTVVTAFIVMVLFSVAWLYPIIGSDFFPTVDAGQLRLHVRCPPGTRIEETERRFASVESSIRKLIPPGEVVTVLDNIGIPNSGINFSLSDGSMISPADGEILISLAEGHRPTAQYQRTLRKELSQQFPDLTFYFAPADIVTQVLNFGLPAPVDLQITGLLANHDKNYELAMPH